MTNNFRNQLSLAASIAAMAISFPAFAQDAEVVKDSGEIIVTARRLEENLQDVPISITVYNQQQLADRNIVNSADLAAYTPSLSMNSKFGPEKASFAIRGFSQDLNTLPTVGVYFADVVAPRLSSNITSGNGAGVGDMFDLQNVQVLKGPQGTLFGRNTTGGAILLVPQKPTDRLEGYVEGSVGSHDMLRGQAVLNVPLSDTFLVRMGVDRYTRDGYVNNRSGIGPKDFNDVNYIAARLSILAKLTPDLENYTIFKYGHSKTNGSLGKYAACYTGPKSFTQSLFGPANCAQLYKEAAAGFGYHDVQNTLDDPFVRSTTWQAINTTTWTASDTLTIKNIASYGEAKESYAFNLEGDFVPTPFVTTYPGPNGEQQGNQWSFTEELQFQGNTSDGRLTWQAGGYMERSSPNRNQTQYTAVFMQCTDVYAFMCHPSTPNIGSVSIAHNNYSYRDYALYGQATYKLTEQLSVTGGIRYTWDKVVEDADNIQVIVNPNGTGPLLYRCSRAARRPGAGAELLYNGECGIGRTFSTKSQEPTWLIDLDYKATEDILIYAKWTRGYRGGGVNEANQFTEVWKPEFVDDYELGIKTSWQGGDVRGTFNLNGFWNEFKDQQVSVLIPQCSALSRPTCTSPAPTGINGIQNIGKSRLRGIEADGSIMLFDDSLRFDFGYAYLDAKVTGGSPVVCNNAAFECASASFLVPGSVLPFAPKNRITLTGTYTLPVDEGIGRISIGATFTHTDKQFSSHANDAAFAAGQLAFAPGVTPFNPSVSPSTDLLNLNLNWTGVGGTPIDLALFATNVTNQNYYVAQKGGQSTLGAEWIVLGEPRMYGMRLKYRFGN